jgi:hypothetical protein
MLTRTSKGVEEEVQKMLLPVVVRLRERGDRTDRLKLIFDNHPFMTSWYRISTLELSYLRVNFMEEDGLECLVGVLV